MADELTHLQCRCSSEWQALPRYCEILENEANDNFTACPCDLRTAQMDARQMERVDSTDSRMSFDRRSDYGSVLTLPAPTLARPSSSSPSSRLGQSIQSPLQTRHLTSVPLSVVTHAQNGVAHPQPVLDASHVRLPQYNAPAHDVASGMPGPHHSSPSPSSRSRTRDVHTRSPVPLSVSPASPIAMYERLVSGQESEDGEAPPTYESVTGVATT